MRASQCRGLVAAGVGGRFVHAWHYQVDIVCGDPGWPPIGLPKKGQRVHHVGRVFKDRVLLEQSPAVFRGLIPWDQV